jgi:hypothetical protein
LSVLAIWDADGFLYVHFDVVCFLARLFDVFPAVDFHLPDSAMAQPQLACGHDFVVHRPWLRFVPHGGSRSMVRSHVWFAGLLSLGAGLFLSPAASHAAHFADSVVSYSPGATYQSPASFDPSFVPPPGAVDQSYINPSAALGGLNADTGFGQLTPFNAAFASTDLVGIGAGGELTLHLDTAAATTGKTLGIHAGVGLIDGDYPNGTNLTPPFPYTTPRLAEVLVSQDGSTFYSLGVQTFDMPSNYYSQGIATPGSPTVSGPLVPADFSKPFTGTLDSLSGETWPQMLATLDGSAGGTWLDLSGLPISGVNYVQFKADNLGDTTYIDSVVVDPPSVPEPASLAVLGFGSLALLLRRKR